jgi:hypothetical protein
VSDYLAGRWLDILASESTWASLHVSDPRQGDPLASEVDGIGYSRVNVTWERGNRAVTNVNTLSWTNLPRVTLWAVGAFDHSVNGNLLFSCLLSDPIPYVNSGGVYTLAARDLTVVVDMLF